MQALQETEMLWHEQVKYQGRQEGKQEILLRQLRRKFGVLPPSLLQRFQTISDSAMLDEIADQLLTAESLTDIHLPTAV